MQLTIECNEPLHLCISAKNQFFYDMASKLIEQLLLDVCRSFDVFVGKNDYGNLLYEMLGANASACTVLKKESFNGHRPVILYPDHRDHSAVTAMTSRKNQKSKKQVQVGQNRNGQPRTRAG